MVEPQGATRSDSESGPSEEASLTIPLLQNEVDEGANSSDCGVNWLSVFNLANAAIGAGVLAFPYAFREAGVLGGLVATAVIAVVEISALCILIRSSQQNESASYQELVYLVLGPRVSNVVSSFIWIYLFGSCVAYLIIIGDVFQPTAQTLFGPSAVLAQRWVILSLFAALVVLPLSLKKTLRSLGMFSSVAPLTLIYLAIAILVYGSKRVLDAGGLPKDVVLFGPLQGYCKAASIVVFAFQCHIQLMPIFAELVYSIYKRDNPLDADAWTLMRRRVIMSMDKVIFLALGTCLIGYSLVGAFGYIAIPDVQSDVLSSFGEDNKAMYIARIGMGFVAIVSYPINHFPARLIELSVLNYFRPLPPEPDSTSFMLRYNVLTAAYVAVTLAVAIAVRDLGRVYMIIGSTGGVLVIFVVPGLLLLEAAGVLTSSRRTAVSKTWTGSESGGVDTTKRETSSVESVVEEGRRVNDGHKSTVNEPSVDLAHEAAGVACQEDSARSRSCQMPRTSSIHFTSIPHVGQRPSEESMDEHDSVYVSKSQRSLAVPWAAGMLLLGSLVFGVTLWIVLASGSGGSNNTWAPT